MNPWRKDLSEPQSFSRYCCCLAAPRKIRSIWKIPSWMLVGLLAGNSCSAAFSSRSQTTLAQAIKRPSKSTYCSSNKLQQQHQQQSPRSFLFSSAAASSSNDNADDTPSSNSTTDSSSSRVPRTGWTHNQPDSTSRFWEYPNGLGRSREQIEAARNLASQGGPTTNKPRTGWLHNQQPRSKADTVTQNNKLDSPSSSSSSSSETTSVARWRLNLAKMQQERNHRIISPPTFHSCGDNGQMVVTEHLLSLPLHRHNTIPTKARVDVVFTIVEQVEDEESRQWWLSLTLLSPQQRAQQYVEKAQMTDASSMIVYLQGGPGFGAPTPVAGLGLTKESSWAAQALSMPSLKRVVLMDQRGTGRSSPITKQSLQRKFPDLFRLDHVDGSPTLEELEQLHPEDAKLVKQSLDDASNFMAEFRADSIVQDAEDIRDALLIPPTPDEKVVPRPWGTALGQSFGGFCLMTYISQVAHPPKVCLFTGGIAPMLTPVYDLYQTLWGRVHERNLRYYEMYPGDVAVVKQIVQQLKKSPATLPSGGKLTARRFLQLGLGLGSSPSTFASLHALLSSAFLDVDNNTLDLEFTRAFLKQIDVQQSFDDHPIYLLLHEGCYADGPSNSPTNWAAHRAYEDLTTLSSDFDYKVTSVLESADKPTLFFGEMVFPWMAEGDYAELSGLGMRLLANALAAKTDWPRLYDGDHMRNVLQDGSISRAAAAVYYDDLYVDFNASMKVAARGGPLEKCKCWVTNEYQHSGLRDNGANMFTKLWGMATGSIRIPS